MAAMRVVATIHFSMPWRNAGSEVVLHELMKAAAQAGHDVTVYCTNRNAEQGWRGSEPDTMFDGVKVVRCRNIVLAARQAAATNPDVWVSHHQHILHSIKLSRSVGARSVYLVHNDMDLNQRPLRAKPDLVIFNSDWVRESLARFGRPRQSMTFHPPVTAGRHEVLHTGDAVTLVNLNEHKGGLLFYQLAELQPERKFLGVVGAHGKQVIRRNLPNVEIMAHTPTMGDVWKRTRVLLMPSIYESYGLVAQEAGINGIPTIANATPGLVENIGAGGLFANRDNPNEWVTLLEQLDQPDNYNQASAYALKRAGEALDDTQKTLQQWVEWIG